MKKMYWEIYFLMILKTNPERKDKQYDPNGVGEHAVVMCPTRLPSLTVSAVSLRSVIILHVVWLHPSTPAGMPSSMPNPLSSNVDASKTQRGWPLSGIKLVLSLRQRACYHRVMSSCRACFVKECQCWFKPSPSTRHAIRKGEPHRPFSTIIIHIHTKRRAHIKNSTS